LGLICPPVDLPRPAALAPRPIGEWVLGNHGNPVAAARLVDSNHFPAILPPFVRDGLQRCVF